MKRFAHPKTWRTRSVAATATLSVVASLGAASLSLASPAVAVADSYGEGDGFNRYVVTLAGDPGVPQVVPDVTLPVAATSEPAGQDLAAAPVSVTVTVPTFAGTSTQTDTAERGKIDLALLAQAQGQLGLDGHVVTYDGIGYYETAEAAVVVSPGGDGTVLPISAAGTQGTPELAAEPERAAAPEPEPAGAPVPEALPMTLPAGSEEVLDALAATPEIVSAQRLYDGQVLVATSLELEDVRALPQVAAAQESVEVPVAANATDPMYTSYGWNLKNTGSNAYLQDAQAGADINAPAGWDVTQGQGTVVAVVDTGFDSDHPDLVGALWTSSTEACGTTDTNANGKAGDCHGWNFYANTSDVDNGASGSHGTTVSGTIAARIDNGQGSAGVAPKTLVMPLVVGGGETVDINLAIQAFRYAVDNGADVINASFGGVFSGATLASMSSAIDYATAHGVPVVAAAGNDAANRDTNIVYPASMPNAGLITVGSTTALDTPATSSAYGQTAVDLYAPGDKVFTTWNDGGYRLVSGTSIAAPHVAAAMALYRSVDPDATVAELKAAVMADSTKLTGLTARCVSGGRLNIGAIQGAGAGSNESVNYEFSSMVAHPGTQQPTVKLVTTASAGTYTVRLGLAMLVDGEVWAVSEEDITLGGVTATTDDTGAATFSLGALPFLGTTSLTPTLTLGEGKFALTAQVYKDGQPMTRPYAAPLVIDPNAALPDPGDVTPGTPVPDPADGGDSGSGTNPGSGADPGTDPGTGDSGSGSDPGASDPGATDPGTTDPGASDPGTTDPGAGATPDPSDPGTPDPGTSDPGTSDPGATTPDPDPTTPGTTPDPGSSDPGTIDPGTSEPDGPDFKVFDSLGAFQVTRISPVHVSVDGGTLVEIRGLALESDVGVRVGATGIAHVLSTSSTRVSFLSPAVVAGTYDVTVYKNGRSSVLPDALVVGDGGTSTPDPTDPGTGDPGSGTDPGTGGGGEPTPTPGSGATPGSGTTPGSDTTPGSGATPGTGTTPDDGGDGDATTPTTPNATRTGPNGERLVRNDALAAMSGLWGTSCSTTCSGQQV